MQTEKLLQLISDHDIIIFGTGFVAELFWQALDFRKMTDRVRGFMRTNALPGEMHHDLPVYSSNMESGEVICLAVHEAVEKEARAALGSARQGNIVWIYPNIHDLLFGRPLIYDQRITLSELIKKQDVKDHWLDIRYLAADAFLRSDSVDMAADLYIRAMSIHSRRETAKKRLQSLKSLIYSMVNLGYQPEKAILTDSDGRIIDGLHRTTVVALLGLKDIPCNVVQSSELYEVFLTDQVRLTDDVLRNAGFTEEEYAWICLAGRQMRGEI